MATAHGWPMIEPSTGVAVNAFDVWVADTVQALSGIRPQYPCGQQRKRVLTCVKTGVVACQEVLPAFLQGKNQGFTRPASEVSANKVLKFRNRR